MFEEINNTNNLLEEKPVTETLIKKHVSYFKNTKVIYYFEKLRIKRNKKRSKKYIDELTFKSCEEIFFFIRDLNKIYGLDLFLYFKDAKFEVENLIIYDFEDLLNNKVNLFIKWYKFKKLYKLNTYYKDISNSNDEYEENLLDFFKNLRRFIELETEYTSKVFEGNIYIFEKKVLIKKRLNVEYIKNLISFFRVKGKLDNYNYDESKETYRREREINEKIRSELNE